MQELGVLTLHVHLNICNIWFKLFEYQVPMNPGFYLTTNTYSVVLGIEQIFIYVDLHCSNLCCFKVRCAFKISYGNSLAVQ